MTPRVKDGGTAHWQAALGLQAAVLQGCWVALRLMIGYRALDLGAGTAVLGVIAASYAAPAIFIAFPAGRSADRLGGLRLTAIGIFVLTGGSVVAAFCPGLLWLVLVGVLIGVGQILVIVGQQSYVAERAAGRSDSAFGMLTSAVSIGQVVGPPGIAWVSTTLAGAPMDRPQTTVGLLVCAGVALLALPVNRVLRKGPAGTPPPKQRTEIKIAAIVRIPGMWRAMLVSGVVLTALDLLYAFVPVWAIEHDVAVTTVGWLLALRAVVTVVSRVGLGRLVAAVGRKMLLLVSLVLAGGGLTAFAFVNQTGAIIAMVALGIGLGLPQPLTMSWVAERADPANRGAALGLRLTVNRMLQIGLPLTVGLAAAPFGVGAIFLSSAVLITGMTAVVGTSGDSLDPGRSAS